MSKCDDKGHHHKSDDHGEGRRQRDRNARAHSWLTVATASNRLGGSPRDLIDLDVESEKLV